LKALTGEFTPPGITFLAESNNLFDRSLDRTEFVFIILIFVPQN